jgi:uncharacterized membrane protein
MESKAKVMGHAMHPILIVFPLGLLSTGVIFDIIYMIWGNPTMATVSYWMIATGIIGGIIAAPFGLIDWSAVPSGTRAKSVGLMHGLTNVLVLLLFVGSWGMRYGQPDHPPTSASVLALIGFALAGLGGWLGGELVERLGVGVHEGAHLNAPNSLTSGSAETSDSSYSKNMARS